MSRRKKRGKRPPPAPEATATAAGPAAGGASGIEDALDVVVAGGQLAEVGGEVLGGAIEAVSSGGEVLGGLAEGLGGCLGGCSTLIAFGIVLATAGAAVARALVP
jgi:hypothetical protein